ncbi:MauE/DoxX family redox-associated membrane protein [Niastella sp. OAS944]|uniref:MauE/DoxX family redox-associated membrane protein n=1 Tax=Niastella sp. OAS944 TaxID=2664089 RepID=UPI0034909B46|nr:putative membrane protein YphA (DoxX/SURF4 family) [Chitinophagaceae bacterium OAS944]
MKNTAEGILDYRDQKSNHSIDKGKLYIEITSLLFILLFLYTGLSKLLEYDVFTVQAGFAPILRPYAETIGLVVPIIEIVVAVLFFIKKTKVIALYASTIMMTGFTIYIAGMLLAGNHLPCICGGVIKTMSWAQHLIFNIVFLLLSVIALVIHKKGSANLKYS